MARKSNEIGLFQQIKDSFSMPRNAGEKQFCGCFALCFLAAPILLTITAPDEIRWKGIIGIIFMIAFILGGLHIIWQNFEHKKSLLFDKVTSLSQTHQTALSIERSKQIRKDPYGNLIIDEWINKGVAYFIENVINSQLNKNETDILYRFFPEIYNIIDNIAIAGTNNLISKYPYRDDMTGTEYEVFCKSILESNGWNVTLTKHVADQGVDLIAEKGSFKVALQCKKYSNSVGNKAVQEIFAGAKHYNVNYCAVVTNSKYTKGAMELAASNNVLLLHHNDLEKIHDRLI